MNSITEVCVLEEGLVFLRLGVSSKEKCAREECGGAENVIGNIGGIS